MATRFSTALIPDNSTDAKFIAWAQFIEDTLVTTGGWTLSTETGETPPASLLHPTVANTKKGFRIYKMSDALQATAPVFMRVDYGGANGPNVPGIWITIGTGSNGAGVITGILYNGGASSTPNVASQTFIASGAFNSYGSAGSNRASIAMFVSTAQAYHFVFTIERSKDTAGNDTADGLMMVYREGPQSATSMTHTRYMTMIPGTQPTAELGLSYVLTRQNPSETFGGDIGVGVISHFKGLAQQPGVNFLIMNSVDASAESTVTVTMYTVTRTYIHLNALSVNKALAGSVVVDANARCLLRYD
jgi:hypothetical protein